MILIWVYMSYFYKRSFSFLQRKLLRTQGSWFIPSQSFGPCLPHLSFSGQKLSPCWDKHQYLLVLSLREKNQPFKVNIKNFNVSNFFLNLVSNQTQYSIKNSIQNFYPNPQIIPNEWIISECLTSLTSFRLPDRPCRWVCLSSSTRRVLGFWNTR